MTFTTTSFGRRLKLTAVLMCGGGLAWGLLGSCNNKLVGLTQYVDPCGTVFNCTPGSFQTNAADVGDYCVDPLCPIPGECGGGETLGTQYDLCP